MGNWDGESELAVLLYIISNVCGYLLFVIRDIRFGCHLHKRPRLHKCLKPFPASARKFGNMTHLIGQSSIFDSLVHATRAR